jgi:hypothetical protein
LRQSLRNSKICDLFGFDLVLDHLQLTFAEHFGDISQLRGVFQLRLVLNVCAVDDFFFLLQISRRVLAFEHWFFDKELVGVEVYLHILMKIDLRFRVLASLQLFVYLYILNRLLQLRPFEYLILLNSQNHVFGVI